MLSNYLSMLLSKSKVFETCNALSLGLMSSIGCSKLSCLGLAVSDVGELIVVCPSNVVACATGAY